MARYHYQTRRDAERRFPHRVDILVPKSGFGKQLNDMIDWCSARFSDWTHAPSPISDPESESYRLLSRTVRQIFPDALVVPTIVIAATDSRHYVPVADDVYRFLPTRLTAEDLSRMHGVDERISISNYVEIIQFYTQLIRNSAG
jgi:acetylornithine deacetylase/succinyl-diaminopimelate desuccinylase-like protein